MKQLEQEVMATEEGTLREMVGRFVSRDLWAVEHRYDQRPASRTAIVCIDNMVI